MTELELVSLLSNETGLAVAGLICLVALLRRFLGARWAWFQGALGGAALAFGVSFGAGLARGLLSDLGVSAALREGFGVALLAVGGHQAFKKLVVKVFQGLTSEKPSADAANPSSTDR